MAWLNDTPIEVIRIDPVRMAHGVLTGIGFLCGGVIFREGLNVRGLTTAASLWMTSTLGMLFGIGFYELAIFGTVVTLLVLAAVTITERHAPQRRVVHLSASFDRTSNMSSEKFVNALEMHGLKTITVDERLASDMLTFSAIADGYTEERILAIVSAWKAGMDVKEYEVRPAQA
jgi:putative Mg2+ transporter-C (MgtC) family protein